MLLISDASRFSLPVAETIRVIHSLVFLFIVDIIPGTEEIYYGTGNVYLSDADDSLQDVLGNALAARAQMCPLRSIQATVSHQAMAKAPGGDSLHHHGQVMLSDIASRSCS